MKSICANSQNRPTLADAIRHPVTLGMMVLWGLNDHVFKDWFSNSITGKLSDVAGLAVVPLIPVCLYGMVCSARKQPTKHAKHVLYFSLFAVGTLFAAVNTLPMASDAYQYMTAVAQWPFRAIAQALTATTLPALKPLNHTLDPSDLWTLPALLIPWWVSGSDPEV